MVDKTSTGVWLLHSTPQFPFRRDQNKFWPQSGTKTAQIFICVTFPYDQFKYIGNVLSQTDIYCKVLVVEPNNNCLFVLCSGKHLQYIRAFPFEHDIPEDFHQELKDAAKRAEIPPSSDFQQLTSSRGQHFHSIAKQQSQQTKGETSVCVNHYWMNHVEIQPLVVPLEKEQREVKGLRLRTQRVLDNLKWNHL